MRKILIGFILILFFGSSVLALDTYITNKVSLGFIKYGSTESGTVSLRPDFVVGPWKLGLDVNMPIAHTIPPGIDTVVFRYAEYDDARRGLRYGAIDNVTWGKGLLMKNYSSTITGPLIPSNQQMSLAAYLTADRARFQMLGTWSHIYALRLTESVHPLLVLGQSYVSDADGVLVVQPDASKKLFPSVSGFGLDATVPLPMNFAGYAEVAQMVNHGNAATCGINWGLEAMAFAASLDLGYRIIGNGFVPGYFNAEYESNPIDFASYEASNKRKDGYAAELKVLAGQMLKLDALYENYVGSNSSFNGSAAFAISNIDVTAHYNQPDFTDFRSLDIANGAVFRTSVGYKINPITAVVAHYKKYYDPGAGRVVDTQYYELRMTL